MRIGSIISILLFLTSVGFAQYQVSEAPWYKNRREAHTIAFDEFGRAWIGTANEIFVDDGVTCEPLLIQGSDIQFQFGGAYIASITPGPNHAMWVAARGGGLFKVNSISGEVRHWRMDPDVPGGIRNDFLKKVLIKGDLIFLSSDFKGMQVFNEAKNEFSVYFDETYPEASQTGAIREIIQDRNDDSLLWIAAVNGLFKFWPETFQIQKVQLPKEVYEAVDGVDKVTFTCIDQDDDGKLWLGTWFFSLFSFDPERKNWEQFIANPGENNYPDSKNLALNVSILDERVAVAYFYNGVNWFNKETREFENPDGLWHETSGERRCLDVTAHKGKLYCPHPSGCLEVDFDATLPASSELPYLKTIEHKTAEGVIEHRAFHPAELELNYGDTLQVEFGATQLFKGEIDLDFRWDEKQPWQTTRPFEPTNITPPTGVHELEVRHRWENGDWQIAKMSLQVAAIRSLWTYWQTYAVIAVIALLLMVWIWRRIDLTKRKRQAVEQQFQKRLAEVQMAALRSQMNPHFLFNSLNSIKDFIILNNPKNAVRYLQKFSDLIRAILENSKENEISLSKELETVKLYAELEALRYGGKFELEIEVDDSCYPERIMVPPLIIQPYVENAIWHGLIPKDTPGLIQVLCSREGDEVVISIEDNGIGRVAAMKRKEASVMKRKSMGMTITRERILLADVSNEVNAGPVIEDLYDQDGKAIGTRIVIRWKVKTLENERA